MKKSYQTAWRNFPGRKVFQGDERRNPEPRKRLIVTSLLCTANASFFRPYVINVD